MKRSPSTWRSIGDALIQTPTEAKRTVLMPPDMGSYILYAVQFSASSTYEGWRKPSTIQGPWVQGKELLDVRPSMVASLLRSLSRQISAYAVLGAPGRPLEH